MPGPPANPPARWWRRVPTALWLVTGLWLSLLFGASVVWPASYGSDEPHHIDMAYDYAAHPFRFYGPGQLPLSLADVGMQHSVPGYPPSTRLATARIPGRPYRPTFAQLGGHAFENGGEPNQMIEHPPLYYEAEALLLRVPGVSGLAWDLQVWLMRVLSIVLMSPVPALAWASSRRLLAGAARPRADRLALLAAAVPLTVPNLVRDGASVNNDALLVPATSLVVYGLARVLTGDLGWRAAAMVSAGLAVALWTKGFALTLPLPIAVTYLYAWWRRRGSLQALAAPVGIVIVGAVAGSPWWLRSLADYHTVQINGFGAAFQRSIYGPPDHAGRLSAFVPAFLSGFASRLWGQIGLPDAPSPGFVILYGWLFAVGAGVAAALVVRGRPGARRQAAILGLVPLLFLAVTMEGSYFMFRKWSSAGVTANQGRYVYPGIAAIAAVAAGGWLRILRPRLHDRLLVGVVAGALVTNAACWLLVLRSWYQPAGEQGYGAGTVDAVRALLRWSPLPEGLTVLFVLVLPAGFGVACLAAAWRLAGPARRRYLPAPSGVEP